MRPIQRLFPGFAGALVLALAAGCASIGAQPTAPAASPTAPPNTQTQPPLVSTPTVIDTQHPEPNGAETFIAWIVGLGPGSPEGPTQVDTYQLIEQATLDSCRAGLDPNLEVPETKALYHGAAAVCLAALYGRAPRWAEAQA